MVSVLSLLFFTEPSNAVWLPTPSLTTVLRFTKKFSPLLMLRMEHGVPGTPSTAGKPTTALVQPVRNSHGGEITATFLSSPCTKSPSLIGMETLVLLRKLWTAWDAGSLISALNTSSGTKMHSEIALWTVSLQEDEQLAFCCDSEKMSSSLLTPESRSRYSVRSLT